MAEWVAGCRAARAGMKSTALIGVVVIGHGHSVACHAAPVVDRQLPTFFAQAKKVGKESLPRFAAPALLGCSGGCGTRAARSDSPRRKLLSTLRYSAAHRGKGRPATSFGESLSSLCAKLTLRAQLRRLGIIRNAVPRFVGRSHLPEGLKFLFCYQYPRSKVMVTQILIFRFPLGFR